MAEFQRPFRNADERAEVTANCPWYGNLFLKGDTTEAGQCHEDARRKRVNYHIFPLKGLGMMTYQEERKQVNETLQQYYLPQIQELPTKQHTHLSINQSLIYKWHF